MIVLALGANTASRAGGPSATLLAALSCLSGCGIDLVATSSIYASEAWPDPSQPAFKNAVLAVRTSLSPRDLLEIGHTIERSFGRVRSVVNAARPLDIDLIDYHGLVIGGPRLILPHPRAAARAFVMAPLAEIAPGWRHPLTGETALSLAAGLAGRAERIGPLAGGTGL
jgi:2-amino-4-hydroxy-6-hydroxymethyldihydropteridine diphosphokinase